MAADPSLPDPGTPPPPPPPPPPQGYRNDLNLPPIMGGFMGPGGSYIPQSPPQQQQPDDQTTAQQGPDPNAPRVSNDPNVQRQVTGLQRAWQQGHPPPPPPANAGNPRPPSAQPPGPQQGPPPPSFPWIPNRQQMYVPFPANRGPMGWGMPRRFPMIPPMWQVPGIFMGLGRMLGMFGSPGLAMMGMGLNKYTAAYMNGYQRGQALYTRQMKEQMDIQADQLDFQLGQQLDTYQRIFREFGDPSDPNSVPPDKKEALEQAIYNAANSMPGGADMNMIHALQNTGVAGVVNQLNWLDAKHGDLKAGRRASSTKAPTAEEQEESGWGSGSGGQKQEQPRWSTTPMGQQDQPRPIQSQPQKLSDGSVPGALASNDEEQLAHRRFRGEVSSEDMAGIPKDVLARTARRENQLANNFDQSIASSDKPEDRIADIKKWDPALAQQLDSVTHYRGKIPYARQGMEPRIVSMAQQIDPEFNPELFKYIADVRDDKNPEGTVVMNSASMEEAQQQVLRAAKELVESGHRLDEAPPWNSIEEWDADKLKGSNVWSNLFAAMNVYSEQMVRVSRGATGAEADVQRTLARQSPTNSMRQILGSLRIESADASSKMIKSKEKWDRTTKGKAGDMPGYSQETADYFKGMRTLDPETFTFGPNAPESLHDVEPGGRGLAEDPEIKQRRAANLQPQIDGAKQWLNDPANTNPAQRAAIQKKLNALERGLGVPVTPEIQLPQQQTQEQTPVDQAKKWLQDNPDADPALRRKVQDQINALSGGQ